MCVRAADTASLHVSGGGRRRGKASGPANTDTSASSVKSGTRTGTDRRAAVDAAAESGPRRGRTSTRRVRVRNGAATPASPPVAAKAPMVDDEPDSPRVKFTCCMSPLRMPRRLKGWTTTASEDASVHSAPR